MVRCNNTYDKYVIINRVYIYVCFSGIILFNLRHSPYEFYSLYFSPLSFEMSAALRLSFDTCDELNAEILLK